MARHGTDSEPGNPLTQPRHTAGQSVISEPAHSFSAPAPLTDIDTTNASPAPGPGPVVRLLPSAPAVPTPTPTPTLTATPTATPTPTPPPIVAAFVVSAYRIFRRTLTPAPNPVPKNMRLMLQMGATQAGTHIRSMRRSKWMPQMLHDWSKPVPYNRFVGIDDSAFASWISGAPLPVRELPGSGLHPCDPCHQLLILHELNASPPGVYMKADPRATRFGIFQMDANPTGNSRIIDSSLANGVIRAAQWLWWQRPRPRWASRARAQSFLRRSLLPSYILYQSNATA